MVIAFHLFLLLNIHTLSKMRTSFLHYSMAFDLFVNGLSSTGNGAGCGLPLRYT